MSIEDLIVEGDLVGIRNTWHGTHKGDFYGIPATGQRVEVTSIGIDRVREGKVVEGWGELDMVGMMQQLKALPKLGPGAVAAGKSQTWGDTGVGSQGSGAPTEDAKTLALGWIEAIVHGDRGVVEMLSDAARYVEHNPCWGSTNLEDAIATCAQLRAALPDLHFATESDIVVFERDRVAVHSIVTGTHTGRDLFGVAAAGKQLKWTHSDIFRFEGGRIVERWVCADTLTLLQELGALPTPGQQPAEDGRAQEPARVQAAAGSTTTASQATPVEVGREPVANEEQNISTVLARIDAVNRVDLDALDQYYTPDYVEHNALGPMPPGLEGVKQTYLKFIEGMPDQHFEVEQVFAEGDKVVVRGVITGTHKGEFFGIPPTNKQLRWTGIELVGMRDGKVAERWLLTDLMGMMQQMGLGPGQGQQN
jgi:steroid delta-isomerase-like uncharacterized protein